MLRPLVLYPLLVGVPALGVAGVLRAGARLQAPPAIGGAWSVEAAARPADTACASRYAPAELRVSQSGVHLTLTWGKATLRGRIADGALTAVEARDGGGCADGPLRIDVPLSRERRPGTLRGTVSVEGCADCPRVPFDATRKAPAPTRGGGR
jgi:hypothetical protein